jgi:hypothetical protein
MGAFDIALAQHKLNRLSSKPTDAIGLLDRVIELDILYDGDDGAVIKEHKRLRLQLQQGCVP